MDPGGLRVLRRIAVGGTAEVSLVALPGEKVAVLKALLPGAGADAEKRLALERSILERIQSPHVVRVLSGSTRSLVLEHVEGIDLAQLLAHLAKRGATLPLGAALLVIERACLGLIAVHATGHVHADVCPGNVLVASSGQVKIIDLGI